MAPSLHDYLVIFVPQASFLHKPGHLPTHPIPLGFLPLALVSPLCSACSPAGSLGVGTAAMLSSTSGHWVCSEGSRSLSYPTSPPLPLTRSLKAQALLTFCQLASSRNPGLDPWPGREKGLKRLPPVCPFRENPAPSYPDMGPVPFPADPAPLPLSQEQPPALPWERHCPVSGLDDLREP